MDERAMSLVLASLRSLIPKIEQADAMFNARLLETYPDIYRRFAMDIEPQERSPVQTLGLLLGHMGRFGAIAPAVKALAPSRKVCRLIDAHYEALAETLMWTLRRSLGATFTAEVERAWCGALWGVSRVKSVAAGNRE